MKRAIDHRVFTEEIQPYLPKKIIDAHVHISLREHSGPVSPERIAEMWALDVADQQSWPEFRSNCEALLPGCDVQALAFGMVYREFDVEANNAYVLQGVNDPANRSLGLFVTKPEWPASTIEEAMAAGFRGIKPYPDLAPQGMNDAGIFDFVPRSHLETLDRLGGVMTLHLPRRGRIADPDNIRELLEIADTYPNIRLIVAHIGRAYCLPTAQIGLPHFIDRPGVYFDTAANLNADVFQYAIETIGPDRIIYGSDLPIMLMRGVREHVGDRYINYTDGDYSWNTNRRSPDEESTYTYYLYEELKALIQAVKATGLGCEGMEQIMHGNAARVLGLG